MSSFLIEIAFASLSVFPGIVIVAKLFKWKVLDAKSAVLGIIFWYFMFATFSIALGTTSSLLNYFFYAFTGASIAISIWWLIKSLVKKRDLKSYKFTLTVPELSLVSFIVVLLVFMALIMAFHPMFVELDAVWDYIPYAKGLLATGGFWPNSYVASTVAMARVPLIPTYYAWGLSVFGEESFRLIPLTFILLTVFSVYLICRELFHKQKAVSLITPAAMLTLPVILVSVSLYNLYVDIPLMAFTAASAFCSIMALKYDEAKWYIFAGIAVALAILSKESGYIALVISICIMLLKFAKKWRLLGLLIAAAPFYFFIIKNALTLDPNSTLYTVSVVFKQVPVVILLALLAVIVLFVSKRNDTLNRNSFKKVVLFFIPSLLALFFIIRNWLVLGTSTIYSGFIVNPINIEGPPSLYQFLRFDLLFDSTGLGNIYLLFVILGSAFLVATIVKRKDWGIASLGICIILLLNDWSFFYNFNFTIAEIRRMLILAPFISIVIAVGFCFLFSCLSKQAENRNSVFLYGWILCAAVLIGEVIFQLDFVRLSSSFLSYIVFQVSGNRFIAPVSQDLFTLQSFVISLLIPSILAAAIFLGERFADLWKTRKYKLVGFSHKKKAVISALALAAIILLPLFSLNVPQLVSDINSVQWDSDKYAEKALVASWWDYMPEIINYYNSSIKDNYATVSYGVETTAIAYFLDRHVINLDYGVYGYSFLRSNSTEELLGSLYESKIRYFLIPNKNATSYPNYVKASSKLLLLSLFSNMDYFVLVKEFPCYSLYKLKLLNDSTFQ